MKIQLLPHYFKYVGVGLFLITGIGSFVEGFIHGYTGQPMTEMPLPAIFHSDLFSILQLFSIIIYATARDKVFDEFILNLRLENVYIVFLGTALFEMGSLSLDREWHLNMRYVLEIQVICYIVLNAIRKRLYAL